MCSTLGRFVVTNSDVKLQQLHATAKYRGTLRDGKGSLYT